MLTPPGCLLRHWGLVWEAEGCGGGSGGGVGCFWRPGSAPQGHFAQKRASLLAGEAGKGLDQKGDLSLSVWLHQAERGPVSVSTAASGRTGTSLCQYGCIGQKGDWSPSVRLLIQEAGEHGEGSLGLVGGDHVPSALDGEKGDVGELLHEASNLLSTVPVVH